ncbi:MAG: hypothetical protein AAF629_28375 [Chloroflexota bacterium]
MALDAGDDVGQVLDTKQQSEQDLLRQRNVVGVGVGYKITADGPTDVLAVMVNVQQKLPKSQLKESDLIPKYINQVRTDVIETGIMRAFDVHKKPHRPIIPGGISLGHSDVKSGTFGCLVKRDSEILILSNNHVLANANQARKGDPILQPGTYDEGNIEHQVAVLDSFVPIDFGDEPAGCQSIELLKLITRLTGKDLGDTTTQPAQAINFVDAALAKPIDPDQFSREIVGIGTPTGSADVGLGEFVKKSGRTTGYTEGRIVQIDVTTSVLYGGKAATFGQQLMADGMSAAGDSGSVILNKQNQVVGLLFAGSETTTLINPIGGILSTLNIEIAC